MNNNDAEKLALYQALKDSDSEIARVTEDLIHLLVQKNVILFTELPEEVQAKLLSRKQLRHRLDQDSISPISEDETL